MEREEIDRLWDEPLEDLGKSAAQLYAGDDAPLFKQYAALLDARVAIATHSMARATRWMALATMLMAVTTLTVGGLAWWTADQAADSEERTACLAEAQAWIALAEYTAPAFPDSSDEYDDYRSETYSKLADLVHGCDG